MYLKIKKYCIAALTIVFSTSMYINPMAAGAQEVSTSQVAAINQSNTYSVYGNIEMKHSGDYDYQILNEQEKLITIRKIYNYGEEVVFPAEIDGYKVSQIGADKENTRVEQKDAFNESLNTVFASGTENVKKIVISEGS